MLDLPSMYYRQKQADLILMHQNYQQHDYIFTNSSLGVTTSSYLRNSHTFKFLFQQKFTELAINDWNNSSIVIKMW